MITYVIPTLWKDKNIFSTIEEFKKIDDKDARLIIINNTESTSGVTGERIDIINMGYNSFVNPAWNLGVELATTEYVCLLNDDIHIDLKTAFLQGDQYDTKRDVVCQLPPEAGLPDYMGARLKRAAYGLNDAPRLRFNRLDKHLRSYGLVPTRADRCC